MYYVTVSHISCEGQLNIFEIVLNKQQHQRDTQIND